MRLRIKVQRLHPPPAGRGGERRRRHPPSVPVAGVLSWRWRT